MKDESDEVIVMFEFVQDGEEMKVIDEKQYQLVSADSISERELEIMAQTSD